MKSFIKQTQVLGFSKIENQLFQGIPDTPQSISALSIMLRVPRTSLYRPIFALKKRGLIEAVKVGRRTYWRKMAQDSLITSLGSVLTLGIESNIRTPLHPEFFLHTGKEALMRLYEKLAEKRGARVLGIQPNKSAESVLTVFPFKRLVRLNERIKGQHVIVEGLLQENFISTYIKIVKKHGLGIKKILKAFGARSADTTYVPSQYFNFDSEIIILPKSAIIFHWSKLVAVEIYNHETIGLLRDLFKLAQNFGHKADQNQMVQEYLEKHSGTG